jgi:iron complex outermembrane receptor protein
MRTEVRVRKRRRCLPICARDTHAGWFAVFCGVALSSASHAQDPSSSAETLKRLSLEELMNVEVTSVSRRPQRLAAAASAIQVVTAEDVRRSGATRLAEALRLASNLEVAQVNSRQWAISARGLNTTTANQLLVLMDGRSLYTPRIGGVLWDVQEALLADIERIEVISGPGATQWGANAMNGVINITTRDARDTPGLFVEGGGGDAVRMLAGLRYGGALGPSFGYRVYAKHTDRDGTVLSSGADAANEWRMSQVGFRADGELSDAGTLTVQGDLYGARFGQLTTQNIEASGANVLGRWSRPISDRSDFKLQLFYDYTHRSTPGSIVEALATYDLDFQHRFPWGKTHDAVWGVTYRLYDNHIHNTPGQAYVPSDTRRELFSGFVQDEFALFDDALRVTVGTKVEHNEYTGIELQPSARMAWALDGNQTLWAAISRAVRTPARVDRELFLPASPPFFRVANPNYDSEELLAYEVGYRVQPHVSLAVSLATFYNEYDRLRSVERANPPSLLPTTTGNGQKGESYGAELAADYRPSNWWRLRLGYTELRVHIRPDRGSTDTSFGANESHDPERWITVRPSLDLPGNWEADATFRYVSGIENDSVPGYSELDLRLAWQPDARLELSVVGQNLLNHRHAEFGSVSSIPVLTRREIERSVYGKLVWRY